MKKQSKLSKSVSGYAWMNLGLVAVFLLSAVVANGQARVRPEIQENTKVEIYRSLEDLLNDKVDQTITAGFESIPAEHGVTKNRVLLPRKKVKEIGKVYGFAVDSEVYMYHRTQKLRRVNKFYKMERIGDYVNYARVGSIWIPNRANFGMPTYRFTYPREELVSVETGKRKLLTRTRLKKILKKDNNLELWKEFKKERYKSMQLIPYLKQHEASTANN
jgi:hypothetical protein